MVANRAPYPSRTDAIGKGARVKASPVPPNGGMMAASRVGSPPESFSSRCARADAPDVRRRN